MCLYIGLLRGEPLRSLGKTKDADYVVACGESKGLSIAEFKLKDETIRLERLVK